MKQFFSVLFGGIFSVFFGVMIAYSGSFLWRTLIHRAEPKGPELQPSSPIIQKNDDATSISGIRRTIRYSASEEEDLINSAAQSLPAGADRDVTAEAYILKNISSGDTIVGHNQDKLVPIASLTKIITAIVARKLIDPTTRITLTRGIMATYGNTASFKVGETFVASDLYYPLLMVSSNDAAEAFAQSYDRKKFIQAMNEFTQSIGAYRTYFADPSGLSRDNVSTARDLTLIIDWMRVHYPDLLAITQLKSKSVRAHTWINPTHFLNWSNYSGGKNGYTPEANRTGAALFTFGKAKNVYAVIVLGSVTRDADVIRLLGRVRE